MPKPGPYIQLLLLGGWVLDITEDTWDLLRPEIDRWRGIAPEKRLECEDIYGAPAGFYVNHVIGFRNWTPESAELYREYNDPDSNHYEE